MGLTAVEIEGLAVTPKFQDRLVGAGAADAWKKDFLELPYGEARAVILNFGPAATTAYVYLRADDEVFSEVSLTHWANGAPETIRDASYPFEFTVPLSRDGREFRFELKGIERDGRTTASAPAVLQH
jgi:hypothetical protein